MKPSTDASPVPRLALLVATGFGLGYLPLAPGTWGSLAGVALAFLGSNCGPLVAPGLSGAGLAFVPNLLLFGATAVAGVAAAGRAAQHLGHKDPRVVVIDEISGQILVFATPGLQPLNWKYLLLGFILFRVFDIWKPFPIRRVESWAGGWGIMGDDWAAGLYAALGLWLAKAASL